MERFKVGVDLGRSEIRLHDGKEILAFPSLIGGPVPLVKRGAELDRNLSLRLDGKSYSLGRLALNQPFLFPLSLTDFAGKLDLALLLSILALYASNHGQNKALFHLSLGIPLALSRVPATLEFLADWQTVHSFEFCGSPFEITIERIDPIPQPLGTLYQSLLNGQLDYTPSSEDGPDSLVGIIDAGHAATSWMVARLPDELPQYSGSLTSVSGIRLLDTLSRDGALPLNPLTALQAVSTDETEETLDLMATQVAHTVKQRWQDLPLEAILITGGIGEKLFERLKEFPFLANAILVEDPRRANVTGYSEFTLALQGEAPINEKNEKDENLDPLLLEV
ncbi:MAG TPA: hypothetical protein DD435_11660 [Cyanobacteria bacterium UBA8530]|nr:hypothetical protein [Cyanobacteria bacterium UBA8530]